MAPNRDIVYFAAELPYVKQTCLKTIVQRPGRELVNTPDFLQKHLIPPLTLTSVQDTLEENHARPGQKVVDNPDIFSKKPAA